MNERTVDEEEEEREREVRKTSRAADRKSRGFWLILCEGSDYKQCYASKGSSLESSCPLSLG